MIDYKLSKEFEEENSDNNNFLNNNQPLLIIIERNRDFSCPLLHPWHYGALIHDLLEIQNNKVEINNEITNNISKKFSSHYFFNFYAYHNFKKRNMI